MDAMEIGQIIAAVGIVSLLIWLVVYFMQKSSTPSPTVVTPVPRTPALTPTSSGNQTIDFLNYFW